MSSNDPKEVQNILYELMKQIDKHEDLDEHPIRESEPYRRAVSVLGWDVDWEKLAEERSL